jgi:hypothetical protein
MSQHTFATMSDMDFEQLISGYIERAAEPDHLVPASIFFDLLLKRTGSSDGETMTLAVVINDEQVTLTPDREVSDIVVRGNEIFIGGHRLVFQMVQRSKQDAPSAYSP